MEQFHPEFCKKMKYLLGDLYDEFSRSYQEPAYRGIRINSLYTDPKVAAEKFPFSLTAVPFCPEGYYLSDTIQGIGKHPYHHAGAFYVQEPSAMSAVVALDPQPGERILDLCAAPGGKSTQIAGRMKGKGILVSNEYVSNRSQILLSNMERLGVSNAVITNMHPEQLCSHFTNWFDRVLVDAPCSGEGMFRKDAQAVREWTPEHSLSCAARQLSILESAKQAVRPGGILVYSTCTFSIEENEEVICRFLSQNPEFSLVPIQEPFGQPSKDDWLNTEYPLSYIRRVFPFQGGEGHFVAKLLRHGDDRVGDISTEQQSAPEVFQSFWREVFDAPIPNSIFTVNNFVYLLPKHCPSLQGLKLVRAGVLAGRIAKNRFIPEHHFSKCGYLAKQEKMLHFCLGDVQVDQYLRGEEISCDPCYQGYCIVFVDGYPLGWGKASRGRLKNHYPKGLRLFA